MEIHAANEHSGSSCRNLNIGGVALRITASDQSPVVIDAQHEPFAVDSDFADINVELQQLPCISPSTQRALFDSGTTWRVCNSGQNFCFDFGYPLADQAPAKRLFVDRSYQSATLQLNSLFLSKFGGRIPHLAYPLDELLIMHRLTQERAIELHGVGIVGPDGASNLFVGHSGAGKSTTARLWTSLHKVDILSDDRIIVRESPARELQSGDDPRQIFMYGTPWHGEGCFALPQRAPLQRIFILEHGHGNVLTRLTGSQMVGELFARAFVPFHRHEYVENALSFLERVADSVPCYRYSFEPDERAVEAILRFND
jgi:hypothetical protein